MKQGIDVLGTVIEHLAAGRFRVQLDSGPNLILYMGGRMQRAKLTIVPGDRVQAELNIYDPTNGRILFRY